MSASETSPQLWLSPMVVAAIRRACRAAAAGASTPETGGKALGCILEDGNVVAILPLEAGPDAEASPTHFKPDVHTQQHLYERAVARHPRLRLVMDWHSHPQGPEALSQLDLNTLHRLLSPGGWGISEIVAVLALPSAAPSPPASTPASTQAPTPADDMPELRAWRIRVEPEPCDEDMLSPEPQSLQGFPGSDSATQTDCDLNPIQFRTFQAGTFQAGTFQAMTIQSMPVRLLSEADPCLDWLMATSSELSLTAEARTCHWLETETGSHGPSERDPRQYARNPLLHKDFPLADCGVTLVGLGSVGAPLALLLAQAGVGRFVLLDEDRLSLENLSRHPGDRHELGWRKSDVVRSRLWARDPSLTVHCPRLDVLEPAHRCGLEGLVGETHLLVVSTDEPAANLAAARQALSLGLPALFVGIFAEGAGGELFAQFPVHDFPPGAFPGCYNCLAGFRALLPPLPKSERIHDYSALRPGQTLPPMNALAIDILHSVSIAARVALDLLSPERLNPTMLTPASSGQEMKSREPVSLEISPQYPLLLVSNGAPVWIFERAFEVIPARLEQRGCGLCTGQF